MKLTINQDIAPTTVNDIYLFFSDVCAKLYGTFGGDRVTTHNEILTAVKYGKLVLVNVSCDSYVQEHNINIYNNTYPLRVVVKDEYTGVTYYPYAFMFNETKALFANKLTAYEQQFTQMLKNVVLTGDESIGSVFNAMSMITSEQITEIGEFAQRNNCVTRWQNIIQKQIDTLKDLKKPW